MKLTRLLLPILLLFLGQVQAQNIVSITQEDITSVGQDVSNTTISITGATIGDTYDIHVDLNGQGIEFVSPASATGATLDAEGGTSNDPIITVTATAEDFEIVIPRKATCEAYDLLSGGTAGAFNDSASIGAGGTPFVPSSNYQVNYAALSIPTVNSSSSSITPSSIIHREVKIVQGLPGNLEEFFVAIDDVAGLLAIANIELVGNNTVAIDASQITTIGEVVYVQITSADMLAAGFGNNNGTFDLNEMVNLEYDMTIDSGCPSGNIIQVNHEAYWGELGETTPTEFCQITNKQQGISFNEELPNLNVTFSRTEPDTCIGYGAGFIEHTIKFTNTGDADAMNLSFEIEGDLDNFSAFDAGNLTYVLDGATPVSVTPTSTEPILDGAGCGSSVPGSENFVNDMIVDIPVNIPPGGVLEVKMLSYACCPSGCVSNYSAHDFKLDDISYSELCGSNLSEGDRNINISSLNWGSSLDAPSNFFASNPTQFAFLDIMNGDLESFLMSQNASIVMEVNLPPGLDMGDASQIEWAGGVTNPGAPLNSNVTDGGFTMEWAAGAFDYDGGSIGFPMTLDCSESGNGPLEVNLYIVPANACPDGDCRIQVVCESIAIDRDCPGDCSEGGFNHVSYDFYRKNIGEIDADNNACPDTDNDCDGIPSNIDTDEIAAPVFNPNQIRKYRAIEGDTIVSDVVAVVREGTAGDFRRLVIKDDFGSNGNRNKFTSIGAEIRYVDFDAGIEYTATVNKTNIAGGYEYRIQPTFFGLSNSNHRFSDKDTIEAEILYLIENYTATTSIIRSVTNNVFGLTTTSFNSSPRYSCTDFGGNINHIAFNVYRLNVNNTTITGCGEKDIVGDVKFDVGRTEDTQFFPYEYRMMGRVDSFAVRIIDTYEMVNAGITMDRIYHNNLDTAFISPTGTIPGTGYTDYIFDLTDPSISGIFSENGGNIFRGDETYIFRMIVNVEPTCEVNSNVYEDFDPNNEVTFAKSVRSQFVVSPEVQYWDISRLVRTQAADISISSLAQVEPYTSQNMAWNLDIRNNDANGNAENIWAIVETPGSIDANSVKLYLDNNGSTTEVFANANDIYELGGLSTKTTQKIQVEAEVTLCEVDSVVFYVGYRCTGYPTNVTEAKEKCFERYVVYVQPEDAQVSSVITPLSSTVNPEDGTTQYGSNEINMCAPFPVEFQIVSGQLEPLDEIVLSVPSLGDGLEFVSGSGYLWYDRNGDGTLDADGDDNVNDGGANDDERIPFETTEDGVITAVNGTGNDFTFDIQKLAQGSGLFDWTTSNQYLPGVKELPGNVIYVRFEMQTTCDVVIGAPITVRTFAQKALCGGDAKGNGELRSGFNLNIAGATPSFTTTQNRITLDELNSCGDAHNINFTFEKEGTNPIAAGDTIAVYLPDGLAYDTFGGNTGDEAVSASPVIETVASGQILKWAVPAGLEDGEQATFSINVLTGSNACTNYDIRMEVQTTTTVSCGANVCSATRVVAGDESASIGIELPQFNVDLVSLQLIGPNQYEGVLNVDNTSDIDFTENLTLNLHRYDGSDMVGSSLVMVSMGSIMNNDSGTQTFTFTTSEDLSLGVMALIPNEGDNCYCGMPNGTNGEFPNDIITPQLPVELISFTASSDACEVSLKWTTATEENFSHYEILSVNGGKEEILGTLEGKYPNGGSYAFTAKSQSGKQYFQLKMVDLDGSIEYSDVVSTKVDCGKSSINVYPNPVRGNRFVTVEFGSVLETENISIIDANGRQIRQLSSSNDGSDNYQIRIELDGLAQGMYFIQTTSGQMSKFIVN